MPRFGAQIGATMFLMAMAAAGPQAAGVAAADSSDADAPSVSFAPARAAAPNARIARGSGTRARQERHEPPQVVIGQSVPGPRGTVAAATVRAARAENLLQGVAPNEEQSRPATASSSSAVSLAPEQPVAIRSHRRAVATEPESRAPAVVSSSSAYLVSPAVPPADFPPPSAATVSQPVAPDQAPTAVVQAVPVTVVQAVNGFFDSAADWLSGLPASPVSDILEGALLLIRRSLFNRAPVAKPPSVNGPAGAQIVGSLEAIDLEGDPITYAVTVAPQHGTVNIESDGTYTYTPDLEFTGADSFAVAVADTGWHINLLQPFQPPPADVVVNVVVGNLPATFSPGDNYDTFAPPVGCECQTTWSYNGLVFTNGSCGNPDGDPNGPWCYTKERANGETWSYCKSRSA